MNESIYTGYEDADLANFLDAVKGSQSVHPALLVSSVFVIAYSLFVGTVMFAGTGIPHVVQTLLQ
jgi:hypothetical protein